VHSFSIVLVAGLTSDFLTDDIAWGPPQGPLSSLLPQAFDHGATLLLQHLYLDIFGHDQHWQHPDYIKVLQILQWHAMAHFPPSIVGVLRKAADFVNICQLLVSVVLWQTQPMAPECSV
jgi:hypothetical protein